MDDRVERLTMNSDKAGQEARHWGGEAFRWVSAGDGMVPAARRYREGWGVRFINPHTGQLTIALPDGAVTGPLRQGRKHGLIVDSEAEALPYLSSKRGATKHAGPAVFYTAFPANSPVKVNLETGTPIDTTRWQIGPLVYHHLKIDIDMDYSDRKPLRAPKR